MRRPLAAAVISSVLLAGCLGAPSVTVSGVVNLTRSGEDVLRLVYLGGGGWVMERGDDVLLTGPLFSNPNGGAAAFGVIRSDTSLVDRYMSRYDVSQAKAILVGHGHYDHLLDVPRVASRHAPEARIVGSRTVANLLGSWSGLEDRIELVEDSAGDQSHVGRWLTYGRVRVMPLRSHHGPHFAGYTLFRGTADVSRDRPPEHGREWVEGETFAFLIDFMTEGGEVAHRIYYQDAVAAPPFGFAPESLIVERSVDVAIIVPSTFEEVGWHPEALIDNLQPRHVVLGHWEDFFVSVTDPMKFSPATNHLEFDERLERVFPGEWWRPMRWTEFRVDAG